MRTLLLAIAIVSGLVASSRARAQDEVIELGDGASVRRVVAPCWYDVATRCSWWEPSGISFGDRPELAEATAFGRVPGGRIVALVPGRIPAYRSPLRIPVPPATLLLVSDDRGASWQLGRWPDPHVHARAFAFDPRTGDGVAVGDGGSVWSSDDHGITWRRRRSSSGTTYVAAWIRGRTCVIRDTDGALWISRDGGFALDSLAPAGSTTRVRADGDEIVVELARTSIRIDARGSVHRI